MSDQTELLPNTQAVNDEEAIGENLEKLFAFQDKHLSKDKKGILVKEILESRIPVGAIILGLRDLMAEDLNSIKMGAIFAAARRHVEATEESGGCQECTRGIVLMKDAEGRMFSLACQCGSGFNVQRTQGLKRWGGLETQLSNGRTLTKCI